MNLISYGEVEAYRPHGQTVVLHDDAELEGDHDELDGGDKVEEEAEGERGGARRDGGRKTLQAMAGPVGGDDHEEGHCRNVL